MANGRSDGSVIIDTKIDTSGFGKGMADAKQKVSAFSGSLNKLGNTIKSTFSQSNTANVGKKYDELRKEIAKTESQLDKLIEKQIRFVETGGNIKSRSMTGMEYDIEMTRNRLEELRNQLSLTSEETPKRVKKMNIWIERLKKSFNSLNKTTKRSHLSILTMLGTSILFSTVFRAINLVTKGFAEGINNIAQYSDKANNTMSALKSSITQLKNSFATAFMPIITAVTPAITQFMSLISKATSVVAAFFSALTGNKTYIKAIEVQEDYAASLDKTAESAKKAQKYLTSLDEIRTFTEKETDNKNVLLPENMFTEEEISTPILNFAEKIKIVIDKIKELIKKEDWEGLSSYLSNGIISTLDFLSKHLDEFDWKGLGEDIGEFLSGIEWLEIIKGALKLKVNIWKAIAEVWLGMWNTAPFETAFISALAAARFLGLGNVLSNAIIAAIPSKIFASKTISISGLSIGGSMGGLGTPAFDVIGTKIWDLISDGLEKMIPQGAFDFLSKLGAGLVAGAVGGSWFPGVGTVAGSIIGAIVAALNSIKIDGKSVFANIVNSLKTGFEFLWKDTISEFKAASYWFEKIGKDFEEKDWLGIGKDILMGIVHGFVSFISIPIDPFKRLFEWIWDGICNIFGIHSPAKEMMPIGKYILLGVINGFESAITNFKNVIGNLLDTVKSQFSDGFKGVANVVIGYLNNILQGIENMVNNAMKSIAALAIIATSLTGVKVDIPTDKLTIPKIPYLASGAVIPPNAPFMAVLGDQRHGTNIEAPLSTIESALDNVLNRRGGTSGSMTLHNVMQVNRRVLYDEFIEEAKLRMSTTGRNPFDFA